MGGDDPFIVAIILVLVIVNFIAKEAVDEVGRVAASANSNLS